MDDDTRKTDKPKGPRGARPAGARDKAGNSAGGKRAAGALKKPAFRKGPANAAQDAKPFRKGPRTERPEGDARRPEGKRTFGKERPASGEKAPFREKRAFSTDGAASKPRREFSGEKRPFKEKRDFAGERPPREGVAERPFRKGPGAERGGEAGKKPFRERKEFGAKREGFDRAASEPRAEGGERSAPRSPRPEWKRDGEKKPFEKRATERPGRFERGADTERSSEKPRSFGVKRHVEAQSGDGARPRSYGQKSHGDQRPDGDRQRTRTPGPARTPDVVEESGERIAKRLARAGIASRREAEDLVTTGRVRVNGKVLTSPAFNVGIEDRIELDGNEIPAIERTRVFLFHKPAGVVTTNRDPEGRKTVFDVLPGELPRLVTVGRLDINTEGLLLLTNDGGLARVLELPNTGWLRRYRVRVHGQVDEKALAGLKDGIAVDGVFYGAIEASLERTQGTNAWLSVGLREGKNREVKNVMGVLGLEVTRLIRVSFGPFQLGELPEGQIQELKGKLLRDQLGERLIEEAGANFEAPITRPFSNRPEQAARRFEEPVRSIRGPAPLAVEPGEGGLIKSRKRRREDARDTALGRLSTKPERGGFGGRGDKPGFGAKPFGGPRGKADGGKSDGGKSGSGKSGSGKGEGREKPPFETPARRNANVWMAPGARPQGKKAETDKPSGERSGRPFADRPKGGDRPRGKPAGDRPRGPRKG